MTKFITKLGGGLVAVAFVASLVPAAAFAVSPTTWYVDSSVTGTSDGMSTTTAFTTIAAAVAAAQDGDTISIAAGSYDAFSIDGKSNLTIEGAGDATIIAPTTLVDTHTGHKYTPDMQASVFVNNSSNVTLENMKIESTSATPGAGGADAMVFWNGSTGSISNVTVAGQYTINGVQSGQGIAVDAGSGHTTTLSISNVNISGYQKNGIDIVNGNGTSSGGDVNVTVSGGSITGAGAISAIAQNGIVAWDMGAGTVTATVDGATISNMQYTPSAEDIGVLAYGSASISTVSNTTMSNVDLYIGADSSAIDASSGNTFDGIAPASASGADLATVEDKLDDSMSDNTVKAVYLLPHTLIVTPAAANLGISGALSQAVSGDTVLVTPGTYAGPVTITTSGVSLEGKDSVTITEGSTDAFGYGMTVDHASGVSVSGIDFDASTLPSGYAFHAYHADDLALSDLTFTGPGMTSTHVGGVDVNTSNNVSISTVTSSGFYKNGFAFTPQYDAADTAADGITLSNVISSDNGWAGIAFYTVGNDKSPTSVGPSASFKDVTFSGTNTVSGNGKGIQVEGDSDANEAANATPANTVTSDGSTLSVGNVAFSGNTLDFVNYQTANVDATSATFSGLTGFNMDSTARAAENAKIIDKSDLSTLGTVTFIGSQPIVVGTGSSSGNSGSHNHHQGSGSSSNNGDNGNTNNTNVGNNGSNNNNGSNGNPTGGQVLGAAAFHFTQDLHLGISGAEVTELQTELIAAGYLKIAAATGWFGPLTKAAVAAWQAAHHVVPASGYFGPLSRTQYLTDGGFSLLTTPVSSVAGCQAGFAFSITTGQACK